MVNWWYQIQQASPCLRWKAPAVQPAPSALGPGCPCRDSGWSNGHLCKYGKTQSFVLWVCSWDPHPGPGHSSPARGKIQIDTLQTNATVKTCLQALCGLLHISEQQQRILKLTMDPHLFAGNESHEDIITDCGGGNIRTWCIKLRVAKFLPVLKWENNIRWHLTLTSHFHLLSIWKQTFLLATAFEAFLVSILKVRTI